LHITGTIKTKIPLPSKR